MSLLTINWLDSCRSDDVTVVGQRSSARPRPAEKSVRTPSQPAFRPSIEKILLYAEPEAGALVPNTRFKRTPCGVPPAVPWVPPSAGAEKWEKWRKWLACQKYEPHGPADCTVAFARRRRRRNDDDKGSISTFENQFSTRAPHNLVGSRFSQPLFFLRKKTRENGRNVHALNSTSRGACERLRDGVGRRGGEHREAQRGVEEGVGGRQVQRLPN